MHNNTIREALAIPGGRIYAAFIDFKKAFDSICRKILIQLLRDLNVVPTSLLRLLCALLDINIIQVHDGLSLSEHILQSNGVMQGDPISALLFILFVKDLPNILKHNNPNIIVIMYADDLVILSTDPCAIQKALDNLYDWCMQNLIYVNTSKSKIMIFRNGGRAPANTFFYNGEALEIVKHFPYLGVIFQQTGSCFTQHITNRSSMAIFAMNSIKKPFSLSINTAIKLFDLKIAPTATYAIEVLWNYLTSANFEQLESVKATFLKRMLCLSKFSSSRLSYELVSCKPFIEEIRERFKLPLTNAFKIAQFKFHAKKLEINPIFYDTFTHLNNEWKTACHRNRHVVTRFAVHGFHFMMCSNKNYHVSEKNCICSLCGLHCGQYHLNECKKRVLTLWQYANSTTV
jgi:hypothetical protein